MNNPPSRSNSADVAEADDSPVTVWLRQLEAGEAQATQPLYQHFCTRLQELVRQRIPAKIRSAYDQDDVAISAFHSLFLCVRQHRYQLQDRGDFWRLLLTIADRKVSKRIRHELRDKRDVRRVVHDSVFMRLPSEPSNIPAGVESLAGREPTPAFAAEVAETCDGLLASLPDDDSRKIALFKLDNHTVEEIAVEMDCSQRTVQRRLMVIRRTWQHAGGVEAEAGDVARFGEERVLED